MLQYFGRGWVAPSLLLMSLGANAALSWDSLSYGVRAMSLRVRPLEGPLPVGTRLPTLRARALNGRLTDIKHDIGKPTIFYIFKPGCVYCGVNLASIRALAANLNGCCRIIGVSLTKDPPVSYLQSSPLPFDVYYDSDPKDADAYFLGSTPSTIVVSGQGIATANWLGTYRFGTKRAIERMFHVSLPEVPELNSGVPR
jgi:hypothetical protein